MKKRFSLIINSIAIPVYCSPASSPSLALANSPTLQTEVFQTTYFTCNDGYKSTNSTSAPFFTCLAMNASIGEWSIVTYSCTGIFQNTYVIKLSIELFSHYCMNIIQSQWIFLLNTVVT